MLLAETGIVNHRVRAFELELSGPCSQKVSVYGPSEKKCQRQSRNINETEKVGLSELTNCVG